MHDLWPTVTELLRFDTHNVWVQFTLYTQSDLGFKVFASIVHLNICSRSNKVKNKKCLLSGYVSNILRVSR